jgi:hypothetical protein
MIALSAMGLFALVLVAGLLAVVLRDPDRGGDPPPTTPVTAAPTTNKPAQVAITPSATVVEGQPLPVNLIADQTDGIVKTRLIVESVGIVAEQTGYVTSLAWPAPIAGQYSLVGEVVLEDGTTVRSPAAVATVTPKPTVPQTPQTVAPPGPPAPTSPPRAPNTEPDEGANAEAVSLVNDLEEAYANENWSTVRRLAPARTDYTDARLEQGWGTLQTFAIFPVSVSPSGGRTRVRAGLVTNESGAMPNSTYTGRFSQVYCITWMVDTNNRTVEEVGSENRTLEQIPGGLVELSDRRETVLRAC